MQTIEYSLDDIGQISFEPSQNIDAELIQCDIAFGFTKKPEASVTFKEIDLALRTETSLLKRKSFL
jgi:hypothetical protein